MLRGPVHIIPLLDPLHELGQFPKQRKVPHIFNNRFFSHDLLFRIFGAVLEVNTFQRIQQLVGPELALSYIRGPVISDSQHGYRLADAPRFRFWREIRRMDPRDN